MNPYILEILEEKEVELRHKKLQKTINKLIATYIPSQNRKPPTTSKNPLQDIQELVDFFKDEKISLNKYNQGLLIITAFNGDNQFFKWLVTKEVCKKKPNLQIKLSMPFIFACMNNNSELIEFLLASKDLPKSNINESNGYSLTCLIEKENINMTKLLLSQPEINIEVEQLRAIYKLNHFPREELLSFIINHEVKEKFFIKLIQYRSEMKDQIREIIVDYNIQLTLKMKESIKYESEVKELVKNKRFFNKLESKLPIKNNSVKIKKI